VKKVIFGGLVLGLALAGLAAADPVSAKAAKKALFAPDKSEVEVLAAAGLADKQAKALAMGLEAQAYYGAVAMSPDDGLLSDITVMAANYHDTDAAAKAALAECDAKKKGKTDCVIVALIRPKGWKDKGFQLSSDATAGFDKDFKVGNLMAISVATGAWAIGGTEDAATSACAAKNDMAKDCAVVIAN
jgi:hypothetical protein